MIIRCTPKNKENYIIVDSETSGILNKNGFYPKYIDYDDIYYVKSNEIIEFMKKEDLKCKTM